MKKYKEWLTNEIEIMESETSENYPHEQMVEREVVLNLINQLDEPEVLSQEWISDHIIFNEKEDAEYIYADKLQNLLVPKQEITFDQVHDKLREESILSEKSFDYYWNCINDNVEIDEPGNLIVPKQEELETKIQELIESYKQEEDAYSNPENGWIGGFIEDLKNLVEKEQKYYVLGKNDTPILFRDYRNRITETSNLSDIYPEANSEDFEFTEQEIKDYDPRYWSFRKPVEELEE